MLFESNVGFLYNELTKKQQEELFGEIELYKQRVHELEHGSTRTGKVQHVQTRNEKMPTPRKRTFGYPGNMLAKRQIQTAGLDNKGRQDKKNGSLPIVGEKLQKKDMVNFQ